MKSYTNIKQSKKLAEILPLESADMKYDEYISYIDGTPKVGYKKGITDGIPCWSLAALINILPVSIKFKNDKYYLRFMKDYVEYANDEVSITGRCLHTTGNNNLVDACYEMILKLKENNKI